MNKIELKVNKNPILKCYLWQLHPLSVVFADNNEKYMPWLLNHYYDIDTIPDGRSEIIILESEPWCYEGEEIFKIKDFSALIDACDEIIFFRLLKNMMRLGYYCATNINERLIPGMKSYKKRDLHHSCLIVSLDEDIRNVEILGYLEDGFIGILSVSYHDIYHAIAEDIYTPETVYVRFFKLNENFNGDCFQTKIFADKVYRYLYGENEKKGIMRFRQLADSLHNCSRSYIDIRNIYVLYEHKLLLYKRLEYMLKTGLLTEKILLDEYAQVVRKCDMLRMRALKYNLTGNRDITEKMADDIYDFLNIESDILTRALKNM